MVNLRTVLSFFTPKLLTFDCSVCSGIQKKHPMLFVKHVGPRPTGFFFSLPFWAFISIEARKQMESIIVKQRRHFILGVIFYKPSVSLTHPTLPSFNLLQKALAQSHTSAMA